MFCNKCGNKIINNNQKYCDKCGNKIIYNNSANNINNIGNNNQNNYGNDYNNYNRGNYNNNYNRNNNNQNYYNMNKYNNYKKRKKNIVIIPIFIILVIILFWGCIGILFIGAISKTDYYFSDNDETVQIDENDNQNIKKKTGKSKSGKYTTAIITDNTYSGLKINNVEDAKKIIIKDSVEQKKDNYPQEIIDIENEIINKYSITAVNLKEMDVEFAKEIKNVVGTIYNEYPNARSYLTNLSLTNVPLEYYGTIALFMPVFVFGESDTLTKTPLVIKTQIQLNAKYFLNEEKLKKSIETAEKANHFPKNTTRYSPVAHEFGHYLSFIALMKNYSIDSIIVLNEKEKKEIYTIMMDFDKGEFSKKMIEEAYNEYLKTNSKIDFDKWRGQISEYALAKDEKGEYIYDETIAEAFHDVYLNGENANIASKYIVKVLKKHIGE